MNFHLIATSNNGMRITINFSRRTMIKSKMKSFKFLGIFLLFSFFGGVSAQPACHPPRSNDLAEHIGHGDLKNFLVDSVKWVVEKEPGRWISCYKTKERATRRFYKKIKGKTFETNYFIHGCLVIIFIDDEKKFSKVKMAMDPKNGRIYSIEFSSQ